jgi:hypothetical protein
MTPSPHDKESAMQKFSNLPLFFALSLSLVGCTMLGHVGTGTPSAPEAPSAPDSPGGAVADDLGGGESGGDEDVPAVRNMRDDVELIDQQLDEYEHALAKGKSPSEHDLIDIRTELNNHFYHMLEGGNFGECKECMRTHTWKRLWGEFPARNERVAKLEHEQLGCTNGFQMANGEILQLSTEWNLAKWNALKEDAKHETVRCWLDDDKDSYR